MFLLVLYFVKIVLSLQYGTFRKNIENKKKLTNFTKGRFKTILIDRKNLKVLVNVLYFYTLC